MSDNDSNPPADAVGQDGLSEFRCFSCSREDCALALRTLGSDVDISDCTAVGANGSGYCNGKMRLKKTISSGGGSGATNNTKTSGAAVGTAAAQVFMLSCSVSTCKNVWWVPKFIRSAQPQVNQQCQRCYQQRGAVVCKILFRFNLEKAPRGVEPECVICPACDAVWSNNGGSGLPLRTAAAAAAVAPRNSSITQTTMMNTNMQHPPSTMNNNNSNHYNNYNVGLASNNANIGNNNTIGNSGTISIGEDYQAALAGRRSASNTTSSKSKQPQQQQQQQQQQQPFNRNSRGNSSTSSAVQRQLSIGNDGAIGTADAPVCSCNQISKILTVSKEGPNKGRTFYSCPKPRDASCGFFQWTDEVAAASRRSSGGNSRNSGGSGPNTNSNINRYNNNNSNTVGYRSYNEGNNNAVAGNYNNNTNTTVMCGCGIAAASRITQKEGPNMGRPFYACSKRRDDPTKCDYFLWAPPA